MTKAKNKYIRRQIKAMKQANHNFIQKAHRQGVRIQCKPEDRHKTATDMYKSDIQRAKDIPKYVVRQQTKKNKQAWWKEVRKNYDQSNRS